MFRVQDHIVTCSSQSVQFHLNNRIPPILSAVLSCPVLFQGAPPPHSPLSCFLNLVSLYYNNEIVDSPSLFSLFLSIMAQYVCTYLKVVNHLKLFFEALLKRMQQKNNVSSCWPHNPAAVSWWRNTAVKSWSYSCCSCVNAVFDCPLVAEHCHRPYWCQLLLLNDQPKVYNINITFWSNYTKCKSTISTSVTLKTPNSLTVVCWRQTSADRALEEKSFKIAQYKYGFKLQHLI